MPQKRRILVSIFSFIWRFLTWLFFAGFLLLLFIGASKELSFAWLHFEFLAPWLALPSAVIGFFMSRFFTGEKARRFFSRTFLLSLVLWFLSLVYVGPIMYFQQTMILDTFCRSERFIEAKEGKRRLAIYKLDPFLGPPGILVRDEKKVLPFVLRGHLLF